MSTTNNAAVAALISDVPVEVLADLNYTFMYSPMHNLYTIFRRSNIDPFRTFPVMNLSPVTELKFLDETVLIKEICELYAKKEYAYNKEKEATEQKLQIKKDDSE